MTSKDSVRALADRLPDDCRLDDAHYRTYVMEAVSRGEEDREAGRTVPHEQVKAELRYKWPRGVFS